MVGWAALPGSGLSKEREALTKDLERHPLTVRIQDHQNYENIPFPFNADSPYQKDPLTKSLKPECLSPQALDYDKASWGRGD